MNNRIIDISEEPAALSSRYENLVIRRDDGSEASLPFGELAVILVSHPRISMTQSVLSGICAAGAVLVACDEKRTPCGMLLPLQGHSTQSERFALQASAPLPLRKRLWKQIVQEKIRAQSRALSRLRGDDRGLALLAAQVRSGDPENVEGRAARAYWSTLFGAEGFTRDPDSPGLNAMLNYGYAVLRAVVARAICASGLHPSLGIHHHNRYDTFPLASDLMEPFRPVVDEAVAAIAAGKPEPELDKAAKSAILARLAERRPGGGETRTLFDFAGIEAASLAKVYEGAQKTLTIPAL
ncbi:MAG TPA: type II CRISPR-associated endonuclease Cas1 [Candidatus Brocadiia bacterium]|nr:type II CRISPR-associated endonuclease Cas1 [Candidatus Brocadiia bacterium]